MYFVCNEDKEGNENQRSFSLWYFSDGANWFIEEETLIPMMSE
jgi:hypothetical protein